MSSKSTDEIKQGHKFHPNHPMINGRDVVLAEHYSMLEVELEESLTDWGQLRLELAALKSQPSAVPDSVVWIDAHHIQPGNNPSFIRDVALVSAVKTTETQVPLVRLNSSPVSAGERCMCGGSPHTGQCLYEHFLSYSGLTDQPLLSYAYFHGAGFAAEIDQPSAGEMDERAAFEAWYLGHFYMGDKRAAQEELRALLNGGRS